MGHSEQPSRPCPRCGGELPSDATGGVCTRCALEQVLASPVEKEDTDLLRLEDIPVVRGEKAAPSASVIEKPGDRIGRYKLLQQIGEGGCGVVYMAEQQEPVRRLVALKVIKAGMDTRQVLARFEAERQALALMDHPNIARVLDAGATETGRPFFVMDLVKGIPMTRYCDENRLDTRQRLELFTQVCQAVQHAHQKGIIHRDIKPSNILVADHDGVPVPKVIDFGLAKATNDQRLTDKTLFTAFEQFIGTPAYMSPEQAKMSGLDIDTRTDIYSLGVLLYELLTGNTPFENKRLAEAGLDEIRRIIREDEPPRPSLRLSTLNAAQQTSVARSRDCEPPGLINLIRGDLDWIVMKTLEKDRTRRYGTANDLAADIQRHLSDEPILARPPGNLYRFQKLVRRNKLAFAATSIVASALVIGLGLSTWLFLKERQAHRRAVAAEQKEAGLRQQADQQRQRAEQALARADLQIGEGLFEKGDDAYGVSYWARLLRQHPTNQATATRLATALTEPSIALSLREYRGFRGLAIAAAFSPDGKRIVVASADATASVFDMQSAERVAEFTNHKEGLWAVDFSPDGNRIVTASGDGTARVWNPSTGQQIGLALQHTNAARLHSDQWITCARFSPDGRCVYTASEDGTARVWDAQTGQALSDWLWHDSDMRSGGFSPDGSKIVTACWAGYAQIWDWQTGKPLHGRLEHEQRFGGGAVKWAEFSPDGRFVGSACDNRTVCIWDANTGKQVGPSFLHKDQALCICFSPDSERIAVGTGDGEVAIWDIQTAKRISGMMRHAGRVNHIEFSGDGLMLVSAAEDRSARLWDGHSGLPLASPLRHSSVVKQARFSPDGRHLLTVSGEKATGEGLARLWDIALFFPKAICLYHTQPVSAAAFTQSSDKLATGSGRTIVNVWDALNGNRLRPSLDVAEGTWRMSAVQFSSDGHELLAFSCPGALSLWRSDADEPRLRIEVPNWAVSACYSPDGNRILADSYDGVARIYSAADGRLLVTNREPHPLLLGAKFSPDGNRFVTFSTDGSARVWDARSGAPVTQHLRHSGEVRTASFDATGKLVATGSEDGTACIWNAATGELLGTLRHNGAVVCVTFDRHSQRLATASWDRTARLWDVHTGRPLISPLQHGDLVSTVQFSPDDDWLVTASADHTARVWDSGVGLPVTAALRHQDAVNAAWFTPDGQRVVTISDDTTARIWELPPPAGSHAGYLVDLAEALTAQRMEEDGSITSLPFAEVEVLRSNLLNAAKSDALGRFARWVLAERPARTVSPTSTLTVAGYVQRLLSQEGYRAAEEAVRIEPTNAVALCRLAIATAKDPENPHRFAEATVYFNRASRFGLGAQEAERVRATLADLGWKP